jgi:ABC-type branched-subunit amino acid transport system ATPase component
MQMHSKKITIKALSIKELSFYTKKTIKKAYQNDRLFSNMTFNECCIRLIFYKVLQYILK